MENNQQNDKFRYFNHKLNAIINRHTFNYTCIEGKNTDVAITSRNIAYSNHKDTDITSVFLIAVKII